MPEDLGARLVRAGLATRGQLTQALAEGPAAGGTLALRLTQTGVSEEALVGLFVSEGYGPLLAAEDLADVPSEVLGRVSPAMAQALVVVPVRADAESLVVAMADPSDGNAVQEMARALGVEVVPSVAKVSDLKAVLERAYPLPPAAPVPLTRAKKKAPVIRKTFGKPAGVKVARAAVDPLPKERPRSIIPPHEASWSELPAPKRPDPSVELTGVLADIRRSESRDEIVRLACEAAATFARSAVFLALRRGVLRGWDGVGVGVAPDALRNLWIPKTSPSMLQDVVESGEGRFGPYGTSAADNLYRAATGSRGGQIAVQPVLVRTKVVAVLCADDVDAKGARGAEILAQSVGKAFQRLILKTK
ncbi:MAG: hypothetical protein AAGE52_20700 [Myxococcota bacterium]